MHMICNADDTYANGKKSQNLLDGLHIRVNWTGYWRCWELHLASVEGSGRWKKQYQKRPNKYSGPLATACNR